MAKKLKINWTFVGLIVIAFILYQGGQSGWFKSTTNVSSSTTTNNYMTEGTDPYNLDEYESYTAELSVQPTTVKSGGHFTGIIDTNIKNGICSIYYKTPLTTWRIQKSVNLNANGDYSETTNIVTAPDTYNIIAICCDADRNCKMTNVANLVVTTSGTDTDGDGIPDDTDTDDDNDGWTDQEEIAAGTDPLDPNDHPGDSGYTCTDSDNGKLPNVYGVCSSVSPTGIGTSVDDSCPYTGSSSVNEMYCDSLGMCASNTISCQTGWVCIGGKCNQPACSGIPFPTSQASCNVGYCGTSSCTFIPATAMTVARCNCQ